MSGSSSENTFVDMGDKVQIKVKFLLPKTVLNCPTFDKAGNVVHPAYTPYTKEDIDSLLSRGVNEIYYSKSKSETHQALYTSNLKNYLDKNVYTGPRSISVATQKKAVHVSEQISEAVKNQEVIDFSEAKPVIDEILKDLESSKVDVINLLDIQEFDDFTHSHSLNVGVIAMTFARKLAMDPVLIKEVGLAGFLHDIGKIRLPYALLHKSGPLTPKEFGLIKKHSRYSYEIVKHSTQLSERIKKIILLHHEKFDGSGYPFGFKDSQLEDGIYVVAIAEFYDALTSKLSYKQALSSKEALKYVIKNAGTHFKPELAHRFAKNMGLLFKESSFYNIGDYVLLTTNEIGKVVKKVSDTTSTPEIEIVKTPSGKILSKPIHVNLLSDGSRAIVRKIESDTVL